MKTVNDPYYIIHKTCSPLCLRWKIWILPLYPSLSLQVTHKSVQYQTYAIACEKHRMRFIKSRYMEIDIKVTPYESTIHKSTEQ